MRHLNELADPFWLCEVINEKNHIKQGMRLFFVHLANFHFGLVVFSRGMVWIYLISIFKGRTLEED